MYSDNKMTHLNEVLLIFELFCFRYAHKSLLIIKEGMNYSKELLSFQKKLMRIKNNAPTKLSMLMKLLH